MMQSGQFDHLLHRRQGIQQADVHGALMSIIARRLEQSYQCAKAAAIHELGLRQINFDPLNICRQKLGHRGAERTRVCGAQLPQADDR